MLFLFSDVDRDDAPTRIIPGSHIGVARTLAPFGERGLSFMELAEKLDTPTPSQAVMATGKAGTVYLCHPFLVHAAQPHRGKNPRFLAQPPLLPSAKFYDETSEEDIPPVLNVIRLAIGNNSRH